MPRVIKDRFPAVRSQLSSRTKRSALECPGVRALTIVAVAVMALSAWGIFPGISAAQTLDQDELKQPGLAPPVKGDWNATLGLGVGTEPKYLGAKDYRVSPIPLVSVEFRDLVFLGPQGLGVNAVRWGGLRAGPVIGFGYGRPESRDPHLSGLGDIQPSLEGGGFISYSAGPLKFAASVRQAMTHTENGLTGRLSIEYLQPLIPQTLILAIGPELDLADGPSARTWFGVTPGQSASSGFPVYTPHGGVRDVGLNASLTYHCTGHVFLRSFIDLRQLTGEVSESPIIQRKAQALIGLGAAYHF